MKGVRNPDLSGCMLPGDLRYEMLGDHRAPSDLILRLVSVSADTTLNEGTRLGGWCVLTYEGEPVALRLSSPTSDLIRSEMDNLAELIGPKVVDSLCSDVLDSYELFCEHGEQFRVCCYLFSSQAQYAYALRRLYTALGREMLMEVVLGAMLAAWGTAAQVAIQELDDAGKQGAARELRDRRVTALVAIAETFKGISTGRSTP